MKKFILILVLFSAFAFKSNAQMYCQASFSYYYDGQSQLYLYDTSFSASPIVSYYWSVSSNIGFLQTSTLENPVFQLNGQGYYEVCLTIKSSDSCISTFCDSIYIGSTGNCNAGYTYINNPTGLVLFTNTSTSNGNITDYAWSFGDGSASSLENPTHFYSSPGTYQVCLYIQTDDSCSNTYCSSIVIPDTNNNCTLAVQPNINPVTIIGGSDGSIELYITGGVPPYTVYWSNGQNTQNIYGLTSGTYTALIDDADSLCPPIQITANIYEPYDTTGGVIIDTMYFTLDSCLNFVADSFYIGSISTNGNVVTVEWVFVGMGATQTITVEYTYSVNGNYIVVLTIDCNGKKYLTTFSSYIHINTMASVVYQSDDTGISLYPNPANELININTTSLIGAKTLIQIYNISGQLVIEKELSGYTNIVSLNVKSLTSGMYFVKVNNNNKVFTSKFIK